MLPYSAPRSGAPAAPALVALSLWVLAGLMIRVGANDAASLAYLAGGAALAWGMWRAVASGHRSGAPDHLEVLTLGLAAADTCATLAFRGALAPPSHLVVAAVAAALACALLVAAVGQATDPACWRSTWPASGGAGAAAVAGAWVAVAAAHGLPLTDAPLALSVGGALLFAGGALRGDAGGSAPSPAPAGVPGPARLAALAAAVATPAAAAGTAMVLGGPSPTPWVPIAGGLAVTAAAALRLRTAFGAAARSEAAVAARERRFRAVVESQSDHVLVLSRQGQVVYHSPSFARLLGLEAPVPAGAPIGPLLPPEERAALETLMAEGRSRPGGPVKGRLRGLDAAGGSRMFEATLTDRADDPAIGGAVLVLHDVTDRERLEHQLRHQALHDPLTGLANRALVLDRAAQMVAAARRRGALVAAVVVDLDSFKDINDSVGHAAGDAVLAAVAGRLTQVVRQADTVGRIGGDEFVVLVEGDQGPERVAERIQDVLREPFDIGGRRYALTASIGIAAARGASAEEILRDADIAMHRAKASGRNRYVHFQPTMQRAVADRLELSMDLRFAVGLGQVRVFYQPIVCLSSMKVCGMEALVRWQHPKRGLLSPAQFIPIAEEDGLIDEVGRYVLSEACAAAAAWTAQGPDFFVSVNVSALQLDSDALVEDVRAALDATGLDPKRLVLEVTESTLMHDPAAVARRMTALKTLGVRVAIDDFGTGYSSFSYLQQFPVDVLKIDRSFVAAMHESPHALALVEALIQLGRALGLNVIAEGVEEAGQLEMLRRVGLDTAQGYLFGRPLPGPDLKRFLDDWRQRQGAVATEIAPRRRARLHSVR